MQRYIKKLSRVLGVSPYYYDIWGQQHTPSSKVITDIFSALGYQVSTDEEAAAALIDIRKERWGQLLSAVRVLSVGRKHSLFLQVDNELLEEGTLKWRIELEKGGELSGEVELAELCLLGSRRVSGRCFKRLRLDLTQSLELGYHSFKVQLIGAKAKSDISASQKLIVVPGKCYQPEDAGGVSNQELASKKIWGIVMQLYSLRSEQNWGIGDYADLVKLAGSLEHLGLSYLGLNPLHALSVTKPHLPSPYSPVSRHWYNPFYLSVEWIAEFQGHTGDLPVTEAELGKLRNAEKVDYQKVYRLKSNCFDVLYEQLISKHLGQGRSLGQDFLSFVKEAPETLHAYAVYEALSEKLVEENEAYWGWQHWPEQYSSPDSFALKEFEESHQTRINYHKYLQWLSVKHLAEVQEVMSGSYKQGLYLDVALSADRASAETWAARQRFCFGVSAGAPPDAYNPRGQNWGFAPANPQEMRKEAYAGFIEVLRSVMRFAGMIRLDHVMSLYRLFWIPAGEEGFSGTYVRYPVEDLFGILALESHRNKCVVVGEDLGTVPVQVSALMERYGVFSYQVMLFMKDDAGRFKAPESYKAQAMVTSTTHDLIALPGYWKGIDLDKRFDAGVYESEEEYAQHCAERDADCKNLLRAFIEAGVIEGDETQIEEMSKLYNGEILFAAIRFLGTTSSKIVAVPLEDLLEEQEPFNVPGVVEAFRPWRTRLVVQCESLNDDLRVKFMKTVENI